jgi:hypothetical protein
MRRFTHPSLVLFLLAISTTLAFSACVPKPTPEPAVPSKENSPQPTRRVESVETMPSSPESAPVPSAIPTPEPSPTRVTWWQPKPGLTWQWELTDSAVDTSITADVYDIDLYADQAIIDKLHAKGAKVICYISVGSWEDWRPDKDLFPPEVLGKNYEGWPGEKWLDIRQIDQLAPIMRARFDLCKAKGFDAIEPDNMEVVGNQTGFPLTAAAQLKYALWLAEEAHARGLAIGQKNAPDQTQELVGIYDFAITEDCFAYGWCGDMKPYLEAGKAVFAAEYTDMEINFASACKMAKELGLSMILKERDLNAWRETCK